MQVEHTVVVQAHAERIFQIYEDVAAWHTWDRDTRRASIEGPFAVLLGRVLAKQLNQGLPVTLANLKHRAEAGV